MLENDNIIIKSYKGLNYLQFKKLLELGIKHAYTLKSEGYDFSKDAPEYEKSYNILAESLGLDSNNILKPCQDHTPNVLCVSNLDMDLENIDGLITNKKNIVLSSKNADCIIFMFYDPVKKVIANIHSGWKGTFKKISEKTVIKMISNYGCNPKDIICFICPSIRKCHFEVEEDVKNLCVNIFAFTNQTKNFIQKGEIKEGMQKYFIDTVLINKILLMELGIKEENIIDCNICSVCNKEHIHSARMEGKNYKRATAVISL